MTLLKGARFALAGSLLLYVLVFGLGWAAMSLGASLLAEGLVWVGLGAVVGMAVSSILCVATQIASLFGRRKVAIGD